MKQTQSRMSAGEKARLRRLRARYRKRMLIVGVIFFILGAVAGALVHGWYTARHPADVPVAEPVGTVWNGADTSGEPAVALTPVPEQASPFAGNEPEDELPKPENELPKPAAETEPPAAEPATEPEQPAAEPAAEPVQPAAEPAAEPVQPAAEPAAETEQPAIESTAQPDAALPDIGQSPSSDAQLPNIGGAETPAADLPSEQVAEADPTGAESPSEPAAPVSAEPAPEQAKAGDEGDATVAALLSEPDVIAVVPFGESYTYTTEINLDGTARVDASDPQFETIRFTQTMKDFMRPSDFANKYATQYRLIGDEAGAAFELELGEYVGKSTIIPQNVVDVTFRSTSGRSTERGYQLMDQEIHGNYDVVVAPHAPKMLYKRFSYSNMGEEMTYLVITTYTGGEARKILFELESDEPEPEPEIVYPVLQKGSKNEDVRTMQERLIELGYLVGKADGDFGKKTQDAIKAAQEAFGMEVTGIADNDFQHKLYEGMDSLPIPVTMQPTAVGAGN